MPADHFPYVHTPEADLPAYAHVRAEGQTLRDAIKSSRGYIRKYLRGRWSASLEALRYFDDQRRLLRWLSERPASGVRLAAVGDIMWLRDSWKTFLTPEVLAHLNEHEIVFGNLETPISTRRHVYAVMPDVVHYNSKPSLVTSFARPDGRNTFTALMTCNNHSLDRGDAGLADTLAFLDQQRIAHAGVRVPGERPWTLVETAGVRVGFHAACWGTNDPSALGRSSYRIETIPGLVPTVRHPVDLGRVREVLADMTAAGVDVRVVSVHWGHEFEFYPTPDLMQVGREIVRAGADVILGTHPHVIQPLEVGFVNGYESRLRHQGFDGPALSERSGCVLSDGTGVPRKALIAYSLGNFATAMYTPHCRTGLVLSLRLSRDADGRVDWHKPEAKLVYNARLSPVRGNRRLMLLDHFVKHERRSPSRAETVGALGRWLDRHLFG